MALTEKQPKREAGERARSLRKTQTVSEGLCGVCCERGNCAVGNFDASIRLNRGSWTLRARSRCWWSRWMAAIMTTSWEAI